MPVAVGVAVAVAVGVWLGVGVAVRVGVADGVSVGVKEGVRVGDEVMVGAGRVKVGAGVVTSGLPSAGMLCVCRADGASWEAAQALSANAIRNPQIRPLFDRTEFLSTPLYGRGTVQGTVEGSLNQKG